MAVVAAKKSLKEILTGAQLAALPQSAIRLLELSKNPDFGPVEFAVPIEADPGLASQVLKFVNSSYFGFAREISSVKLAISLVGVRTIKNFALWSAVFSLMPNPKCGPFDLRSLWQDSLRRGLFSRSFGKQLGLKDAEDLFAAALLQDMAIPLLAKEFPTEYGKMLVARSNGKLRLSAMEKQEFGWTHAEAGGVMARAWNLPEEFARLIETHGNASEQCTDKKQQAVGLSSLLPSTIDSQWSERESFLTAYERLTAAAPRSAADFLGQVDKEYADMAPILKLPIPKTSLVQCLEAKPIGV